MRKLRNEELNRLSVPDFKKTEKLPLTVILDNVRSLHNIGSVFRTADAFLIERIFLCGITARPPHRDIHKSALGATESVEWSYFGETLDAVKELKADGYTLIAVEQTDQSVPLEDLRIARDQQHGVIFGHEIRGVDQKVLDACDISLEIPQFGTKHSLNISVSAGIVLWRFYHELRGGR